MSSSSSPKTLLNDREIAWLSQNGPFPFVCDQGQISWPEHELSDIVKTFGKPEQSSYAAHIVGKIKRQNRGH